MTINTLALLRSPTTKVLGGSIAGQLIVLGSAPLIVNSAGVSAFGTFSIATAVAVPLSVVLTCRYELAVPLPRRDEDAASLTQMTIAAATALAVVLAVVLLVLAFAGDWIGDAGILGVLWSIPALAWSMAVSNTAVAYAIRGQRYSSLAKRSIAQASMVVVSQLMLLNVFPGPEALIAGSFIGQCVASMTLLPLAHWAKSLVYGSASRDMLRSKFHVMKCYRRHALHMTPAGLLNSLSLHLPVPLFGVHYGALVAGQLGLAQRIAGAPVNLVAQASSSVYTGGASQALREGDMKSISALFRRTSLALCVVSVAALLGATVVLPPLITATFGDDWLLAGRFVCALGPMFAAQIVASPLSQTLVLLGRSGTQLCLDIVRLVIVLVSIGVAGASKASPIVVAWSLSISMTLIYAATWLFCRSAVSRGPREDSVMSKPASRQYHVSK